MARVYSVQNEEELTMVTANSPTQAVSHVAKNQYKVHVATALEVVDYMQQGGEVENANEVKEIEEEKSE
jgi:hypothetical protein